MVDRLFAISFVYITGITYTEIFKSHAVRLRSLESAEDQMAGNVGANLKS